MIYTATSCISPSTELVVALIEGFVLHHIIGLDGSTEPGGTGLHPPTHPLHLHTLYPSVDKVHAGGTQILKG